MICDRIRPRPHDLPQVEPPKASLLLQHAFLFVVHIDQIQLSWPLGKAHCDFFEQAPHDRSGKRVKQKHQARTRRKVELRRISTHCARDGSGASCRTPCSQIPARNSHQSRMQLHAHYGAKGHLRCQQQRPAHSRAHVNKGELFDRRHGTVPPPAPQQSLQNRWRDRIIRRAMPVMPMPSFQMSPSNEATGAYPIGHIERVAHESVAYRQPRQQAPSLFPPAQETLALFNPVRLHVCTLAQSDGPVGGLIWLPSSIGKSRGDAGVVQPMTSWEPIPRWVHRFRDKHCRIEVGLSMFAP